MIKYIKLTKAAWKKLQTRFLAALVAITGIGVISSCGSIVPPAAMYMPAPVSMVSGQVLDAQTHIPIKDVQIELLRGTEPVGIKVRTDINGIYRFSLSASFESDKNLQLVARDIDGDVNGKYEESAQPLTITLASTTTVDFSLKTASQ